MSKADAGGPNYEVEIDADELLARLADDAASYGADYEEKRQWWRESLTYSDEWTEARYWMFEARGGQRALSETLAKLQPGGEFRNDDGTVAVRGLLRWLSRRADSAHDRSHGPYTETRHADEAETAFASAISTVRNEWPVGWPRLDDIGGNPIQEDLP